MKHPLLSILTLACAASLLLPIGARATTAPPPVVPSTFTEVPAWADTFVDSIGVDSTYGDHTYAPEVTTMLKWSGIRHMRDSADSSALMIATYADLGKSGIKHSIGVPLGFQAANLTALLTAFAPYVDYVEGPNEADNTANPDYAALKANQALIWSTVRGNPAFSNVAVYGMSFANPLNGKYMAPMDGIENFAQLHNATCDWNPGTAITWVSIAANTVKMRISTTYKPIITTETGFNDNPARGCHLSDPIIAKYTPRTSAERFLAGEPKTYFTFLVDNPNDPVFGAKGLLFVNGTPKPAMLAEGNMIHLLSDKGVAPALRPVTYGINGATVDVHHLMLSRQDGSYDLMLWRELPCWDHFGHKAIVVPALPVTVQIPAGMRYADLYAYNSAYSFSGIHVPLTKTGLTATFMVTDSISVLHIRPV